MNVKAFLKLGSILAAWSVIACAALATTQVLTEKAAKAQDELRTRRALASLFPDMETSSALFEESEGGPVAVDASARALAAEVERIARGDPDNPRDDAGTQLIQAWAIRRKDAVIGLAIKASGPSYSGRAEVLTGVDTLNQIAGVSILTLKDTPGLGQNAKSPGYFIDKARTKTWYGQFTKKPADDRFAVGTGDQYDVQAITASTITSKGITTIVRVSASAALPWLADNARSGASQ